MSPLRAGTRVTEQSFSSAKAWPLISPWLCTAVPVFSLARLCRLHTAPVGKSSKNATANLGHARGIGGLSIARGLPRHVGLTASERPREPSSTRQHKPLNNLHRNGYTVIFYVTDITGFDRIGSCGARNYSWGAGSAIPISYKLSRPHTMSSAST